MSVQVDLIATLVSGATGASANYLYEALRSALQKKGIVEVSTATPEDLAAATKALTEQAEEITGDDAHSVAVETLNNAQQLTVSYQQERMRQATLAFNTALLLSVVGVLIIFAAVVLLFVRENVTAGALTAGVGGISEIIALILFKLSNDANNRLDHVGKDLGRMQLARVAADIGQGIEDPEKRDHAIRDAAKSLGDDPPSNAT